MMLQVFLCLLALRGAITGHGIHSAGAAGVANGDGGCSMAAIVLVNAPVAFRRPRCTPEKQHRH